MPNLKGRIIVVTGAAGRLGSRMVQRFAEDGAAIAAIVRSEEDARTLPFPEHGEGWAFPVDVTDEELVRACFTQIRDQFGRIDAVVHTVGMWAGRPFGETTLEHWETVMRVNLTSTFLCFREAVRVMEGQGCLVAFAAAQGADRGAAEQAAYSASKAGLIRLVDAVSAEYEGVTAHVVAPSTLLYDGQGRGVEAEDVVELTRSIVAGLGGALDGTTIRAYGSRSIDY